MKAEDGVAIEPDLLRPVDEKGYGVLVVENHLGFACILPLRLLPCFDKALRIEQRIGVALQTAGVPRTVDQQPVEDLLGKRARRLLSRSGRANFPKLSSLHFRKIEGLVGQI